MRATYEGLRMGRPNTITPEQNDILRACYPTEGAAPVAARLGVSVAAVRNRAWRLGIKSAVRHELGGATLAAKNRTARLDFFDTWTPESAYVLGYIWADGCIREVRGALVGLSFLCTADDAELLRSIAAAMGHEARLKAHKARAWGSKVDGTPRQSKAAVKLAINSRVLATSLVQRHGLAPRKSSLDLPYPSNIPDELLPHFARGNLDGDGTVCVRPKANRAYVGWLGTPRFVAGLAAAIARVAGVTAPTLSSHGANLLGATWTAKANVLRLREWLYADSSLHLPRKRAKIDQAADLLASVRGYSRRRRAGGAVVRFAPAPVTS